MKPKLVPENASHEGTFEAEILRCDVAIVGGGIAGIACAERLAREAWRQRKRLRIVVIEQRDELGAAASRRLEGWYHTGALYSNLDDPRMFTYFLFAFEDLYNWYHYDQAFPFWANCNLSPITAERPRPGYDFLGPQASRWFVDEIAYIMPREPAAQTPSYAARRSRSEWESAAARAKWLVANTFYRCSWRNEEFGCAQAPHLRASPDSHGDFEIPRDLINESFEDVLAACFSGQDSSGLGLALGELARRRSELEEVTREIQTSDQTLVDIR